MKTVDLTKGDIVPALVRFSLPLVAGNLLQQCYNIADTVIVGRFIGDTALAAVGSAYSLMVLLTSILLGLSMGSGAYLSIQFGRRDRAAMARGHFMAFCMTGAVALVMNALVYLGLDGIMGFLRVPVAVYGQMRQYLLVIFAGLMASFLYNYYASSLRALGDSVTPLLLLGVSSVMNVALDVLFVAVFAWGVRGAAAATVLSQYVSGLGLWLCARRRDPALRISRASAVLDGAAGRRILSLSALTCLQQSIMNFGILMIQGLVNSFGPSVMAAFAAAVKVDAFAYAPVQDFGNAFSTFVAQNHGAGETGRIRAGLRKAAAAVLIFCLAVSALICLLARPLMGLFTGQEDIIAIGAGYLRIEGAFYCLIGFLFLFYGYFRAVERPGVSVALTVISLGARVALSYGLAPALGCRVIWASIPIGWVLADMTGLVLLKKRTK